MKKEKSPKPAKIEAVERNIATIHRMRVSYDAHRSLDQKVIDVIASFAGRPSFLYLHAIVYGSLFLSNKDIGAISAAASLEAIFLSLFVLINQKRMDSIERKNADLHLQMSLLSEHELTRVARVTDQIAKRLGVDSPETDELSDVKRDVYADDVLNRISEHEKKSPTMSTADNKSKK